MDQFSEIKHLIAHNEIADAISRLNTIIDCNSQCEEAFLLRGHAYRKMEDWRMALNNYAEARKLNPGGPAELAYNAIVDILNFYNTDLYNP